MGIHVEGAHAAVRTAIELKGHDHLSGQLIRARDMVQLVHNALFHVRTDQQGFHALRALPSTSGRPTTL